MTTALQSYQFTIDNAVKEWLEQKRTRTGSERTAQAYRDTVQEFRAVLGRGELDLLSNPIDVARVAGIWANSRKDSARTQGDVTPSTYNQRLAILSSFYTFLQETYKLDIPNPIESVKKRPVQAVNFEIP
jgi:site-specific recombinase XerD